MDKRTTITAIRKESFLLRTDWYRNVLDEFSLMSFSVKCIGEMNLIRLLEMLGKIRRLVASCK